jgi:hypothetical protein
MGQLLRAILLLNSEYFAGVDGISLLSTVAIIIE